MELPVDVKNFLVLLLLIRCHVDGVNLSLVAKSLVDSNNKFGLSVYKAIIPKEGSNVMVSPWSLSTALGMLYLGTGGNSSREIYKVLQLRGLESETVHYGFLELNDLLTKNGENFEMNIFNAAVIQERFNVSKLYRERLLKYYKADVYDVDFIRHGPLVMEWLNAWTKLKTEGKIKDILTAVPSRSTRLILLNANYFKGLWLHEFSPSNTTTEPFYNHGKDLTFVSMMQNNGNFSVYSDELDIDAVVLPMYGNLSFLLIMPEETRDFSSLEQNITLPYLQKVLSGMSMQNIKLKIPKFKIESKFDLQEPLQSLEMTSVFEAEKADLSNMSDSPGIYVQQIIHQVGIDVNEKGAEASAVSVVTIVVRQGLPTLEFNKPFMYFIIDAPSGIILYMGRVVEL